MRRIKVLTSDTHLKALALFTLAQARAVEMRRIEIALADVLSITREELTESPILAAMNNDGAFHAAFVAAGFVIGEVATRPPAVPIAESVTPDHIVCLEDGAKLQTLKRYLRTKFNLSVDDYRRKWGLPPDYPMTAPNYSARRSQFAKDAGLGTSPKKRRNL